jgi:zinc protease
VGDVKAFHKDFYGASNAELAIVGDFDPAEVQALVTTHFGAWSSPKPFARVDMPFVATKPGAETIDTPDKEGGFIVVVQALALRDDDPDYPALQMANYVLGGGSATRLNNRLRQKEGWSYGAFSALRASALDTRALFFAGALVNPQNAPKALAALLEETSALLDKGIPEPELADAKESWKSGLATDLANDDYVVKRLAQLAFLGRTLAWDAQMNEAIAALTSADIAKVLAKGRVAPAAFARFVAADQKKAAAPEPKAEHKDRPAPK